MAGEACDNVATRGAILNAKCQYNTESPLKKKGNCTDRNFFFYYYFILQEIFNLLCCFKY